MESKIYTAEWFRQLFNAMNIFIRNGRFLGYISRCHFSTPLRHGALRTLSSEMVFETSVGFGRRVSLVGLTVNT